MHSYRQTDTHVCIHAYIHTNVRMYVQTGRHIDRHALIHLCSLAFAIANVYKHTNILCFKANL